MRRETAYFVIDTSSNWNHIPFDSVRCEVKAIIKKFLKEPFFLELLDISIISYNTEAKIILPSTDINTVPLSDDFLAKVECSTSSIANLGLGLSYVRNAISSEFDVPSADVRQEHLAPIIIILSSGIISDRELAISNVISIKEMSYPIWKYGIINGLFQTQPDMCWLQLLNEHSGFENVTSSFYQSICAFDWVESPISTGKESNIKYLVASDGSIVSYVNEVVGYGNPWDVYLSQDQTYVVALSRDNIDANIKDRIKSITGCYKDSIFNNAGGDYWKNMFCWPTKVVEWNGKFGVVLPTIDKKFFFSDGKFKGKEKNGKWFYSAKLMNKFIEPNQKGDFHTHMLMCIKLARAVRKLHSVGLAIADFSYNKILADPLSGSITITDINDLVIPGKYPPEVMETPDFMAPEVLETRALSTKDPNKKLTSINTNRHTLAVHIYMLMLQRHPLRGGKVHNIDPAVDEELTMGKEALFIEHPTDKSNRPNVAQLGPSDLPQGDVTKRPYTVCGPYLKDLFDRAFIQGLHNPMSRPSADEWESALLKTTDLMIPCSNPSCPDHWFVFDNSNTPQCPFCGTIFHGELPVLNFYCSIKEGTFHRENYRLMVYDKQMLYMWHVNHTIANNEMLSDADKEPVGEFQYWGDKWILINRRLNDMWDKTDDKQINIGEYVELTEGRKILLDRDVKGGARLIVVQLVLGN